MNKDTESYESAQVLHQKQNSSASHEEANQKLIELPAPLKENLQHTLDELRSLREEMEAKRTFINEKSGEIKTKFEKIKGSRNIKVRYDLGELFEKTSHDYSRLIDFGLKEVDLFLQVYGDYTKGTSKTLIEISQKSPLILDAYVQQQIKLLKRFIKRKKKDFSIYFSRYDHGFDRHMHALKTIEPLTKPKEP